MTLTASLNAGMYTRISFEPESVMTAYIGTLGPEKNRLLCTDAGLSVKAKKIEKLVGSNATICQFDSILLLHGA